MFFLQASARAAAAVPRCPVTAGRLRAALEFSSSDSAKAGTELGTECHLDMAVPCAFHAIVHATSFEGGAFSRATACACISGALTPAGVERTLAFFFSQTSRSMPTANAEGSCRVRKGGHKDANLGSDVALRRSPSACSGEKATPMALTVAGVERTLTAGGDVVGRSELRLNVSGHADGLPAV